MGLQVSVFSGLFDKDPKQHGWEASFVAEWLRHPLRGAKDSAPLWSPCVYMEGKTRGSANVQDVTALVLDFDGTTTWEAGVGPWRGWCHFAHTSHSHSHGQGSDLVRHCFRVVVPLEEPIPMAEFPRLWAWAFERSPEADPQCKDAARMYYQPCHAKEASILHYWYEFDGGQMLNWRALDLPPLPAPPKREYPKLDMAQMAPWQRAVHVAKRVDHDAEARIDYVLMLGGEVIERPSGRVGHRMMCPQCGQASLCMVIDYNKRKSAWCEHKNSCGYEGFPWRRD